MKFRSNSVQACAEEIGVICWFAIRAIISQHILGYPNALLCLFSAQRLLAYTSQDIRPDMVPLQDALSPRQVRDSLAMQVHALLHSSYRLSAYIYQPTSISLHLSAYIYQPTSISLHLSAYIYQPTSIIIPACAQDHSMNTAVRRQRSNSSRLRARPHGETEITSQ
jgi:hypothetical protein